MSALLAENFDVEHVNLCDIDLTRNYNGYYVIYPSCEKRGLIYKGYIEDILLKLQNDGATLLPRFSLFKAHGNKVMQELIRTSFENEQVRFPKCSIIGRFEDLNLNDFHNYPYVVKSASGSGSSGVILAKNEDELCKAARKLSRVSYHDYYYTLKRDFFYLPPIWNMKVQYYKLKKKSQSLSHPKLIMNDNKFIIQEFIDGLKSDYKVLYYTGRYYVLNRRNRSNDFRASGSGLFEFPEEASKIEDILNFARLCAKEIDSPMISMDIGRSEDGRCYLIEFQCIDFGVYTIQFSKWSFTFDGGSWKRIEGEISLEEETARAIREYIGIKS